MPCLIVVACSSTSQNNPISLENTNIVQNNSEPTTLLSGFCLTPPNNSEYILGLQDKIKVSVMEEKNLSGDFTIDNNGMITLPLIGDIGVSGCSVAQAKQIITDHYADGYLINPNIAVEIEAYSPIYIIGEVRAPGKFDYTQNMNVLKAVALAGGFTYRANKKTVQILRKNSTGAAIQNSYPTAIDILPGDIITIKERLF